MSTVAGAILLFLLPNERVMSGFLRASRPMILGLLLLQTSVALAQDYKIGDEVVVAKAAPLELVDRSLDEFLPGMNFGFDVTIDPVTPPGAVFSVDFVKGDRLVVSSGPLVWIDVRNVIRLDAKAADHFTRLIEAEPKNAGLYAARVMIRSRFGEPDRAMDELNEAIRAEPDLGELIVLRGRLHFIAGDHEAALKDFNAALELATPRAEVLALRGETHYLLGKFEEALADFDEALGYSSPGNLRIIALRGDVLAALGDTETIDAEHEAAAIEAQTAGMHYFTLLSRGQGFIRLEQFENALETLDEALELSPNEPSALAIRAAAYLALGDRAKAYADLRAAWRQNAGCQRIPINRAMRLVDRQEADEAIAELNDAIRAGLQLSEVYRLRGEAWNLKKEYDKALADFDTAIEIDSRNANAYFGRSVTHYLRGDVEAMLAGLDQVLTINPDHFWTRLNRAVTRSQRGDLAGALADYDEAVRLAPEDALVRVRRGLVRYAIGQLDGALADLNEAIRLDSRLEGVYNNRGMVLVSQGNFEQAIADYDEDLRSRPNDSSLFNRAVCHLILGRPEAIQGFQDTLAAGGWNGQHAVYATICGHLAAKRLGDERAATSFLTESIGKLPEEWPLPIVKFFQGRIDEAGLLALAHDVGQQTEVRCYLGLSHLIEHRDAQAFEHLRWVSEHGPQDFAETVIAKGVLRKSEQSTAKPDEIESRE